MQSFLAISVLVVVAGAFNIDVFNHAGDLLTSTKFHLNMSDLEDYSGSGDFEPGSGGDMGLLWDDEFGEEPESPWEFDEVLRKYNHLEYIYPKSIVVPLNFPTRKGDPSTSPQDKIYPILGSEFQLSFPNCSKYQKYYAPLGNDTFHPSYISFTPTPHNQSLTLKLTNIEPHWFLIIYVACLDIPIRGRVFHLNDPEITYMLVVRPNFQNLTWFVQTTATPGTKDEFHAYINVTYEADASYWYNPEMFWMPLHTPLGLPDQPIPFRLSHSLNITMTHCPGHVMLLHPYKPYRSPDGRVQVFPKPNTTDSYYYGFFDVTQGTGATYMTICQDAPTDDLHDRYMVFRPNFRDMEFSASTLPFYDVPVVIYPNLVLWRHPDWAFVYTNRYEQVFPIERLANFTLADVTIPAGLAGWRVQFTMDELKEVVNLTTGVNKLPDGGEVILNVTYDGQRLQFDLLNISDSDFGEYEVTVMYTNGTWRTGFYQRNFFIRPHLRPSFFNPDVKAPYTHRFPMPWDPKNPQHRAMALQAAMEGVTPETGTGHDASLFGTGAQFFFLVCAIAVLGLSVVVMLLAMRYVRPIIVNTHQGPSPIELEEGEERMWLKRQLEPWNYSSSEDSGLETVSETSL